MTNRAHPWPAAFMLAHTPCHNGVQTMAPESDRERMTPYGDLSFSMLWLGLIVCLTPLGVIVIYVI